MTLKFVPSICSYCGTGCGVLFQVMDGQLVGTLPMKTHPVNQGKLCARGQAALQELYDPDRLRSAVQQTGGRGSLIFEP